MMKFLYQQLLKPVLFRFDPEDVHDAFVLLGQLAGRSGAFKKTMEFMYGSPQGPVIIRDGLKFHGPVILSAGFDYNAHLCEILWHLGFAGEEVGSVTARPTQGNPKPRLKRLINSGSIQVYKGLRNDGVDVIIQRIKQKKLPKNFVLGISIAKTNDELSASMEEGIKDYCYSLKRLVQEQVGDFYTINISCPNAFGGEDFAHPERLEKLLLALKSIPHDRPMYVKMPINLPWETFMPLLDLVKQHGLQGVVIGNLNKNYQDLSDPSERPQSYRGGLSGNPCFQLSNELIQKSRARYPADFTIIGCGGIMQAEDAVTKMSMGADLVELITGMIFNGPHLMGEINRQYKNKI
jgi:dihydroorotate dehydrogenase